MFKFIKIQKKPYRGSLFFFEQFKYPKEYHQHNDTNYIKTGKLISIEKKLSDDKLEMTTTMVWRSRKDFISYVTDPYVYGFLMQSRDYEIDNDITIDVVIEKDDNE